MKAVAAKVVDGLIVNSGEKTSIEDEYRRLQASIALARTVFVPARSPHRLCRTEFQ